MENSALYTLLGAVQSFIAAFACYIYYRHITGGRRELHGREACVVICAVTFGVIFFINGLQQLTLALVLLLM